MSACPICGSENLQLEHEVFDCLSYHFDTYNLRCLNCGSIEIDVPVCECGKLSVYKNGMCKDCMIELERKIKKKYSGITRTR